LKQVADTLNMMILFVTFFFRCCVIPHLSPAPTLSPLSVFATHLFIHRMLPICAVHPRH
jgi:hypothetical protein